MDKWRIVVPEKTQNKRWTNGWEETGELERHSVSEPKKRQEVDTQGYEFRV